MPWFRLGPSHRRVQAEGQGARQREACRRGRWCPRGFQPPSPRAEHRRDHAAFFERQPNCEEAFQSMQRFVFTVFSGKIGPRIDLGVLLHALNVSRSRIRTGGDEGVEWRIL